MATWDESLLPNDTCPECGTEYRVKFQKLPLRDEDHFTCDCGHVMKRWKETGMYTYEAIKGKR